MAEEKQVKPVLPTPPPPQPDPELITYMERSQKREQVERR